jgi:hypothetical protein
MSPSDENKVTLEDLLKVKRLEQPEEVFWSDFDSQFKRKLMKSVVSRAGVRTRIKGTFQAFLYSQRAVGSLAAVCLVVGGVFLAGINEQNVIGSQEVIAKSGDLSKSVTFDTVSLEGKNYVYNSIQASPEGVHYSSSDLSTSDYPSNTHYLAGNFTNLAAIGSRNPLSF